MPLIIVSSRRPTHISASYLLMLALKEYMGYDTKMLVLKNLHNLEDSLRDIANCGGAEKCQMTESAPRAMINIEVWLDAAHNLSKWVDNGLIENIGPLGPRGRYSILYVINNATEFPEDCLMDFWEYYKRPDCVRGFHEPFLWEAYMEMTDRYKPDWCNDTLCADLVVESNEEHRLLINIHMVADKFTDIIRQGLENNVLFFSSLPNMYTMKMKEGRIRSVSFPRCMDYDQKTPISKFCHFEMHQMQKVVWPNLKYKALDAYQFISKFSFSQIQYESLLADRDDLLYPQSEEDYYDIACNLFSSKLRLQFQVWLPNVVKPTLYIGGIFPTNGTHWSDPGILPAAELAAKDIDDSQLLPGYALEVLQKDGNCDTMDVISSLAEYGSMRNTTPTLIGLLGPGCTDAVEPATIIATYYKMTLMSFSADGTMSKRTDSDDPPRFNPGIYNNFFRTTPDVSLIVQFYCSLFKKLNWEKVGLLYEDSSQILAFASHKGKMLEKCGILVPPMEVFTYENKVISKLFGALRGLKKKKVKIIIGDFQESLANLVICQAKKEEMTAAEGYQWILPAWYSNEWYNKKVDEINLNHSCSPSDIGKFGEGYLTAEYKYFTDNDTIVQNNITFASWLEKYTLSVTSRATSLVPSKYAGFAYDAVWAYGVAFDKMMTEDPNILASWPYNINNYKKFQETLKNVSFQGVSGYVSLQNKSRIVPVILKQFRNGEMIKVADYDPIGQILNVNESLHEWIEKHKIESQVDRIKKDECPFQALVNLGLSCEQARLAVILITVLGGCTFIMGLMVFIIKRSYENRILQTESRMRELGLSPSGGFLALDQWEIPRDMLVLNRKLGEGAFGTVYGGEANVNNQGWVAVAVKALKTGGTQDEKLDFLREAEIMKQFDHKNIIKMIGVVTRGEPVYTIMEFMLYGDLKTFLLSRRDLDAHREEVSNQRLTSMALDISHGLCYLWSLKFIHRDLACRNCLVNSVRTVKIGDFGMCRGTYDSNYYKLIKKGIFPVRWMAPESISEGVFTHKTDVWSFGVILYELVTFGSVPYRGLSNTEVMAYITSGKCLQTPAKCTPQLRDLMDLCLDMNPDKRPTAFEIMDVLAKNPDIVTPCLDAPITSVELESYDLQRRRAARKSSMKKASATVAPMRRKSADNTLDHRRSMASVSKELAKLNLSRRGSKKPLYQNILPLTQREAVVCTLEPYSITTHI
ncbi:Vkr [Cordylochernes scorpioides]|uniref:Vkr n=1 Tax=Cordylochernes scorpioides TaxID=51811 RepID=A0ABY6KV32_9ARAC|nr:Vkr [Cordylochernes scorpioides]